MVEVLNINLPLIVGDGDYLIEGGENNSKIVIYKEEGDVWFKVAHIDGIVRFYITQKMAKELSEKLKEMTNE